MDPVYGEPTSRVSAAHEVESFGSVLRTLTPRGFVTEAIVACNVLVYAAMVARGVSAMSPTTGELRTWGADYGPLTISGEWWRIFTAMFVHIGALHIAMNMYVLWNSGRLVERMFGNVGFLLLYVGSGLVGSVASLVSNPLVTSAGASGAIFGVYGGLLGFALRQRSQIPGSALTQLLRTGVFFVGTNILIGMQVKGIDMSAHVGGLFGGFLLGLVLALPLTADGAAARRGRNIVVAMLLTGFVLVSVLVVPRIVLR